MVAAPFCFRPRTPCHKRRYRKLRIPRRVLEKYLKERTRRHRFDRYDMPAAALCRESSSSADLASLVGPVYPHLAFGSPTLAGSEDG